MTDPHAICRKWVKRLGAGFNPESTADQYTPEMGADEAAEYDADMVALWKIAENPFECAIMAMADDGLDTSWYKA